jgi:hypothetical protein
MYCSRPSGVILKHEAAVLVSLHRAFAALRRAAPLPRASTAPSRRVDTANARCNAPRQPHNGAAGTGRMRSATMLPSTNDTSWLRPFVWVAWLGVFTTAANTAVPMLIDFGVSEAVTQT